MCKPEQPVIGVGAVIFQNDAVLLVKRKNPPYQGQWAIPGGKVQLGETLQQAAEREILEETGIKIKAEQSIYSFELIEKDEQGNVLFHYVIIDLAGRYVSGNITASDDAIEAKWVTNEEALKLNVNQTTKQLLSEKYRFNF